MGDRIRRVLTLLSDPRTPALPKVAVGLAVLYLLWPIDLLPDFAIPIAGFLDDLVILWTSLRWLVRRGSAAVDTPRTGGRAGPS
jgi:uncharacterized membrane protein YkvA (DUF1232 family)